MNTELLIMAAGMGSRFGGLKQIEPIGPNGEIILDFSVYDAEVNLLDGGILESDDWLKEEYVMQEVLGLLGMESMKCESVENFWL